MTDQKSTHDQQEEAQRKARAADRKALVIRNRETSAKIERARLNGDRAFRLMR